MRYIILATGAGLILYAYLNWCHDLVRTWVKQLATRVFGSGGGPLGAFAETRVAQIYYRPLAAIFAALLGAAFLMVGLRG